MIVQYLSYQTHVPANRSDKSSSNCNDSKVDAWWHVQGSRWSGGVPRLPASQDLPYRKVYSFLRSFTLPLTDHDGQMSLHGKTFLKLRALLSGARSISRCGEATQPLNDSQEACWQNVFSKIDHLILIIFGVRYSISAVGLMYYISMA